MMIKSLIKKTFMYKIYRATRLRSRYQVWTEQDSRLLTFYSEFIGNESLCFDVGANVGNRTNIFLKLGARVVAVEPQKSCAEMLRIRFGNLPKFALANVALGEFAHKTVINIDTTNTISSMNPIWINRVKESGRFPDHTWSTSQKVQVITLDDMIKKYGVPSFLKIDVEGYEEHVVRGLTVPITNMSIEYTPEFTDSAIRCIKYICVLGKYELNFSKGESMVYEYAQWLAPDQMIEKLMMLKDDLSNWGDIYFKLLAP